jgi:hypothetical protein
VSESEQEREARQALDRVRRDSETLGSSSLARLGRRLGDHFEARDAVDEGSDPVEIWGRRIGRGLSVVGVIVLSLWLAVQLGLL